MKRKTILDRERVMNIINNTLWLFDGMLIAGIMLLIAGKEFNIIHFINVALSFLYLQIGYYFIKFSIFQR